MYNGKITSELKDAYRQYMRNHGGMGPDEYDDIDFESMPYEKFLEYIKISNERGCEIVDLIP